MPTYEYECRSCGHTFEALQSMNDKPLSRCPKCKSSLRRVINGGMGVIFKGSGFYSTDNKKGSALTPSGNGGSKEKATEGSSEKASTAADKTSADKTSADKTSAAHTSSEKTAAS